METQQQEATLEQAKQTGLSEREFELITKELGRKPNTFEVSIYGALWSDQYSNKNAGQWLSNIPTFDGIIDLGNGIGCSIQFEEIGRVGKSAFQVNTESIARYNAFFFGNIEEKDMKQAIEKSIKQIDDSTQIVGNDVFFDDSYNSKPSVHQFSAGIANTNTLIPTQASGPGNIVYFLQSEQVSLSARINELIKTDALVGIKFLNQGGIAGAAAEMSFSGNVGMDISIDKVNSNEKNAKGIEKIISPSTGAFVVVKKGEELTAIDLFKKAELNIQKIGVVKEGGNVRFLDGDNLLADLPSKSLVPNSDTPRVENEFNEPSSYSEAKEFVFETISQPEDLKEIAIFLLKHQNIASNKWINDQIKSTIGSGKTNSDAAVVSLDGQKNTLNVSLGAKPSYTHTDPEKGIAVSVAQAARNIICSGGTPLAMTYNLNFGNPKNPEHYWQFVSVIKGMTEVCSKLNIPVSEGNVSFDPKDSKDKLFSPTSSIGMIGLTETENTMSLDFKYKGDLIFILGENIEDVGSSEYLNSYHSVKNSPAPHFSLEKEVELHTTVKQLIRTGYVNAVHSVSVGGIFMSLARMGMSNELGFDIVTDAEVREDAFLFGEASGRVIATVTEDYEDEFIEFMMNAKTQFTLLGHVTKGKMVVDDEHYGFIKEAKDIYENALGLYIEK